MDSREIEEMLRQDRAEWDVLARLLDSHPEQPLHAEGAPWTARDIYAHVAHWMAHSNTNMQALLSGGTTSDIEETDEVNTLWQQEDSRLSLEAARRWASETFERRLQVIHAIAPDAWNAELEAIARCDGFEHYVSHRLWIMPVRL